MASPRTSPTALRWELGARLRALRIRSGLSIDDAARELMCSQAKVSRMETAGRGIQPRDVRDLCRLYEVSESTRDELLRMAQEARKPGWWQLYGTLDEQTVTYIGLESAATSITSLEFRVVPGLLQTREYARILLQGVASPPLNEEQIEEAVLIRQRRAERILNGDVRFTAITDEAVFYRTLGDSDVLLQQIAHLVELASLPNVQLQILPRSAAATPAIHGSFLHLTFEERELLDVIYFEGLLANSFIDRPADVETCIHAYEASKAQALSHKESLAWLRHRYREEAGSDTLRRGSSPARSKDPFHSD